MRDCARCYKFDLYDEKDEVCIECVRTAVEEVSLRNLPKAEERSDKASHAVLDEGPTIDQCKDLLLQLQRAGIYTLTDKAFGDMRYDELKIDIIKKWIVGLSV